MSRQSARSGLRPDQKPPELSRPWGIIVVVSGEVYLSLHDHAQTIAITGRSYRLKDHAAVAGKEDKNKKTKSKSNEPSTAEPAS
jgi:hypothetical protein